ncbi:hypothetical protein FGO68_gene2164 [Halteria grandinella]|uniref:Uncharacterized protein n=1 Tax=Halteria grandinella TaxID=5974 RepID=A0A8J8NLY3_HALGN|nr:hypothetical protein FGO68_gene2164 [Halteria grandinella]
MGFHDIRSINQNLLLEILRCMIDSNVFDKQCRPTFLGQNDAGGTLRRCNQGRNYPQFLCRLELLQYLNRWPDKSLSSIENY